MLEEARARKDRIVVTDSPLLFEAEDPASFDAIVLVDAPDSVRRTRLLNRGLSVSEAERMMEAQIASVSKRSRSDYVIDNDGDLTALEQAAALVWQSLLDRA